MGTKKKRRNFRPEYKAEVVGLFRKSGKKAGEIARDLGPTETSVRAWIRQAEIDIRPAARRRRSAPRRSTRGAVTSRVHAATASFLRAGVHSKARYAPRQWQVIWYAC